MFKRICMSTILFFSLVLSISHAGVELTFGLYTSDQPTALKKMFAPILKNLEEKMNVKLGEQVKIKIVHSRTYEQGINKLVDGKVDFVRFGPASYIEAKQKNPGIQILAVEANKGKKVFNGVICVAQTSTIQSVADLKGKSFGFGDKRSTIGRYLSQQYLVQNGIKASDLSNYEYLKNHKAVAIAVARGKFDAGALKENTYLKIKKTGAAIRSIASFPNMTKPWIARSGLPDKIRTALKESLLEIKDPEVLKKLKKSGFLPGNDDDFKVIRYSIKNNDLFFK